MQFTVDVYYNEETKNLTVLTNAQSEEDLLNRNNKIQFTERTRFYGIWNIYSLSNKVIYYNINIKEDN